MKIILFMIAMINISCTGEQTQDEWNVIYKCDEKGNAIMGGKQELIEAVRKGASIKIGWGVKGKNHTIEHVSEPIWIAVLDGSEIVAHLEPQILSKTDWENLSANYSDSLLLNDEWRAVVTSKGEFDAVWYDRKKNQITKRRPQKHIITWFVKDSKGTVLAKPLFEKK